MELIKEQNKKPMPRVVKLSEEERERREEKMRNYKPVNLQTADQGPEGFAKMLPDEELDNFFSSF